MQVDISSGREQKAGCFKPNLLNQVQAWASSNVAGSIMLLPSSSSRERSSTRAGFCSLNGMKENTALGFSPLPATSLQLQCHSAVLCCEICLLGVNLDLSNWEILYYNPSKWQLSCC